MIHWSWIWVLNIQIPLGVIPYLTNIAIELGVTALSAVLAKKGNNGK